MPVRVNPVGNLTSACGHPEPVPGCLYCYQQVREALKAAESALNKHIRSRPVTVHVLNQANKG